MPVLCSPLRLVVLAQRLGSLSTTKQNCPFQDNRQNVFLPLQGKSTVSWFLVETSRCQRNQEGGAPIHPAKPLQGEVNLLESGAGTLALGDLLVKPSL